jgi:hypothetical protein
MLERAESVHLDLLGKLHPLAGYGLLATQHVILDLLFVRLDRGFRNTIWSCLKLCGISSLIHVID